jgi:hypothetical protein
MYFAWRLTTQLCKYYFKFHWLVGEYLPKWFWCPDSLNLKVYEAPAVSRQMDVVACFFFVTPTRLPYLCSFHVIHFLCRQLWMIFERLRLYTNSVVTDGNLSPTAMFDFMYRRNLICVYIQEGQWLSHEANNICWEQGCSSCSSRIQSKSSYHVYIILA